MGDRAEGNDARAGRDLRGEALVATMDDKVIEQVTNVATLPGIVGASIAMPDAHWGYGFPIGGVAAFDPDEGGVVSAGGVGFDISCGVRCCARASRAHDRGGAERPLADALVRAIPAGVGSAARLRLDAARAGRDARRRRALGGRAGLRASRATSSTSRRAGASPAPSPRHVSRRARSERQRGEIGTLGSGNHYLEVQRVTRSSTSAAARRPSACAGRRRW